MSEKVRLDIFIKNKYDFSRDYAKELIEKGGITVNGRVAKKAGTAIDENDAVELDKSYLMPYVGRGGLKLEGAINEFKILLNDKTCIDIGASTGGFTDCMLQNGANKVFAIDVGSDQLAEKLKNDNRVISMENTDIRNAEINEKVDFISIDVSFISLTKILENAKALLNENGEMIALIKPQFEAGRENIGKSGIVKNPKIHKKVIKKIYDYANEIGLLTTGIMKSPITGTKGNTEYLIYFNKNGQAIDENKLKVITEGLIGK